VLCEANVTADGPSCELAAYSLAGWLAAVVDWQHYCAIGCAAKLAGQWRDDWL